jgi:hypothetical protein
MSRRVLINIKIITVGNQGGDTRRDKTVLPLCLPCPTLLFLFGFCFSMYEDIVNCHPLILLKGYNISYRFFIFPDPLFSLKISGGVYEDNNPVPGSPTI